MEATLKRERIDAALRRPWYVQRLGSDLEADFEGENFSDRRRQIAAVLVAVLFVELLTLFFDFRAGCFLAALKLKIFVNSPVLIIGLCAVIYSNRRKYLLHYVPVFTIPFSILTTTLLGVIAPVQFADRYIMSAGLLGFAANLIMPLQLRAAIILCALNLSFFIGLPLLFFSGKSLSFIDIFGVLSGIMVLTLRTVRLRERAEKNAFLFRMRDRLQTAEMSSLIDELTSSALTDALTNVGNRRSFDLRFANAWRSAEAGNTKLSLLMIDVDHFKLLNDAAGHTVGDQCLQTVASVIASAVDRDLAFVSRYGGEEFTVIIPNAINEGNIRAEVVAERIRCSIVERAISHPGVYNGIVTVSIGVATMRPGAEGVTPAIMLEAADNALYGAKRDGRNRVNVFGHLRFSAAA